MKYITNNCGNLYFHFREKRGYDHPFIGSLFVNDLQYVKFCKNFLYYLKVTPRFGNPDTSSTWAKQNGRGWFKDEEIFPPYPVMYLEDIEIHWIHEKDENELMGKYKRRLSRFWITEKETIVFLLSDADLCNNHSIEERKNMLKDFMFISNSIYLSKYEEKDDNKLFTVKRWVGQTDERNVSHIPLIQTMGERMDDYKNAISKLFNVNYTY